jgi:hypothetical protein
MSIHRLAAIVLVPLLVAPPSVSVASAAQAPVGSGLEVSIDPSSACVIAGEHPQFQGSITPMSGVRQARLFFQSALSPDVYSVPAVLEGGRYVARVPCPRLDTGSFTFYLEASGDGGQGRSAVGNAIVVRRIEDCPGDRRVAPMSPGGPVSVFGVAGSPALPAGFEGVTGAAACAGAGANTAAPADSFFESKAGALTLAAAGLGIGAAIFFATRDDEPTSPSR